MGEHLIDDRFQSDKYPDCPRGKVPLSTKDPLAQDLLWKLAGRYERVDREFADDLRAALLIAGYVPPAARGKELTGSGKVVGFTGQQAGPPPSDREALSAWLENLAHLARAGKIDGIAAVVVSGPGIDAGVGTDFFMLPGTNVAQMALGVLDLQDKTLALWKDKPEWDPTGEDGDHG